MPELSTTEQRHKNMAAIRGKDTKPEMIVRKYLWSRGFRYRLNHKRLPGKPDIVLRKYRTCIFVNGCFWHGHRLVLLGIDRENDDWIDDIENSECCKIPHTHREFWLAKILRNRERDIRVQKELAEMGWHCITVWECELSTKASTSLSINATQTKSVREETLERLAFTLNHIYLMDHSSYLNDPFILLEQAPHLAAESGPKVED